MQHDSEARALVPAMLLTSYVFPSKSVNPSALVSSSIK